MLLIFIRIRPCEVYRTIKVGLLRGATQQVLFGHNVVF